MEGRGRERRGTDDKCMILRRGRDEVKKICKKSVANVSVLKIFLIFAGTIMKSLGGRGAV